MKLAYKPLLALQRELQAMPRGPERFDRYLRLMLNETRDDLILPPLNVFNPMGKEHVTVLLDQLIAIDADAIAASAVVEASQTLADTAGSYEVALVVADDAKGAWTNRYDWEFAHRFENEGMSKRGWIYGIHWSSEAASIETTREAILTAIHRLSYVQKYGPARDLAARMRQEGAVMARACCRGPVLDEDDLAYTREIVKPFLGEADRRTSIEVLFGDDAGRTLGFTPRGLSRWAGLALALHDQRAG